MQRKAQGLSLNTIVIAAIVLIVLVVVITIFYRSTGDFDSDIQNAAESECEGTGLIQRNKDPGCQSNEKRIYESFGAEFNKDKVCCRSSGECLHPNECMDPVHCDQQRELLNFKCGTGEVCCGPEP